MNILLITSCSSESVPTAKTLTATQTNSFTTTSDLEADSIMSQDTTLTKTAILASKTPIEINDELITYSVLDLYIPPYKPPNEAFPILMVVANNERSQGSCVIPIVFTNLSNQNDIVTYVIRVIFDIGETKTILTEGIRMEEGYYSVQVGQKASRINIT